MRANIPNRFCLSCADSSLEGLPSFLCPGLKRGSAISPRLTQPAARSLETLSCRRFRSTIDLRHVQSALHLDISRHRPAAVRTSVAPLLLRTCPGCGAAAPTLDGHDKAGHYNPNRKSVKTFLSNMISCEAPGESDGAARAHEDASPTPSDMDQAADSATLTQHSNQAMIYGDLPSPICNRCHNLMHHNKGHSSIHPTLQSIQDMMRESPYSYNHIYHVLDAADFPLSLIPQLQRRLELMPQRAHNRRANIRTLSHNHRPEMSFIITRSDLLAPQKEQVDSLMPYLQKVLRDALGSLGKDVRLGNIRCVSAKRGWWTRQVKNEIWERGGGGWLVGKVNVGKSNLFECIFPKGGKDRLLADLNDTSNEQSHHTRRALRHPMAGTASDRFPFFKSRVSVQPLLPPLQPEIEFPVMPTVSHLPGTTVAPIRIPFGNGRGELIDLPGVARGGLEDHVVESRRLDLIMRQRVKPEQFTIQPGQSLVIAGLIRITPTAPGVTVLAYPFVPLSAHVTSTEKAISIHTQTQSTGVPIVAKPEAGQKMRLAGTFELHWDVTKQRAGPLTSSSAVGLEAQVLPFVVYSNDILLEGCGWIELVAQVRKRSGESMDSGRAYPAVEVWSPNGDYIATRQPMNGWLLGKPQANRARTRPRRSMKGFKKGLKRAVQN